MRAAHELRARIDAELAAFVEGEIALLEQIDPQLVPIGSQLRAAIADGKRIRAAFCYWGWRSAGQADNDAATRAAAAMELVHAAALVHDDLIDDSALRRGLPTPHMALRETVPSGAPDPANAARSLAMLVGDLLMAWAGQLFATCGLPSAYLARARPMWAALARELIAGECLEILRTGAEPGADSSIQIARYKTAKYTVEHPLHIGGLLGGASERLLGAFSAYGVPLGEAFQLRDDLLAVYGDPAVTGKSNLDDIAGRRPTALLAHALHEACDADRTTLRTLLGRVDLDAEDLATVRTILDHSGARARTEVMIADRAVAARAALASTPLPRHCADALHEMTHAVTVRTF